MNDQHQWDTKGWIESDPTKSGWLTILIWLLTFSGIIALGVGL